MSKINMLFSTILALLTFFTISNAQDMNALDILKKSDEVVNAPKDQSLDMKLILIDKDGNERERTAAMLQKGSEKNP